MCIRDRYQGDGGRSADFLAACARLFAREAVVKVYVNGLRIAQGCQEALDQALTSIEAMRLGQAMKGSLSDMDGIAAELVK